MESPKPEQLTNKGFRQRRKPSSSQGRYSDKPRHTYLLAYLLTCLLACLLAYLLTCLLAYLLTYLLAYLLTYLLTCLLAYLLTYLLTPWSRVLLEKQKGSQELNKFPAFYGTRRFIKAFKSARHLSLSWAKSIQFPQLPPTSWRSILILSSHLRLGLPSGLFPSGFPTRTLCTPLPSPILATCPAHLILLDFTTRTILGKEYRSLSNSLCNFPHSPVTSSLLGPNTLLSTLFSNTLSLRSTLIVSDQVSHPYRTTGTQHNIKILTQLSVSR